MSLSKSRWKGALLAAASAAVLAPASVNAATGSMVVSLSLSPLGSTGYKSTEYIAPTGTDSIYVYATVTGGSALTASEIDGLQYLYYNVNQAFNASTSGIGSITAAQVNTALLLNGNGSQNGTLHSTGTVAVGGTTLTDFAKPRSSGAIYSTATADGVNVIKNGSSVSFLVETLTYTPTFSPKPAVAGTADSVSFSLSIPSAAATAPYYPSNYFTDMTSQPGTGLSPTSSNTFNTGYTASASSVTLIDGEQGDVNLDGTVNGSDLSILATHYNQPTTGYTNGDLTGDGLVNGSDLSILATNYNVVYSSVTPSGVTATAQFGGASVPEPASLGLVAVAGLAMARRRSRTSI
jgi:hypothetical protein